MGVRRAAALLSFSGVAQAPAPSCGSPYFVFVLSVQSRVPCFPLAGTLPELCTCTQFPGGGPQVGTNIFLPVHKGPDF